MSQPTRKSRERAAHELAEILDAKLFRALCDPVRQEIVGILTLEGRANVQSVAQHLPQDRSVISRHLAVLHDAGIVRRTKEGRHVFFEVDGPTIVKRMEKILERFRKIVPLCCPPDSQ